MKEAAESRIISRYSQRRDVDPLVIKLTWTFVPPIPKLFMLTLSRRSLGHGRRSVGTSNLADLKGTIQEILSLSVFFYSSCVSVCMFWKHTSRIRALELDVG